MITIKKNCNIKKPYTVSMTTFDHYDCNFDVSYNCDKLHLIAICKTIMRELNALDMLSIIKELDI